MAPISDEMIVAGITMIRLLIMLGLQPLPGAHKAVLHR